MKITMIDVTKIVPVLLLSSSMVEARFHTQCSCDSGVNNSLTFDWQLTFNACVNNYSGEASYNPAEGRCHWFKGHHVQGDDWNAVCIQQAIDGYYPVTNGLVDTTRPKITGRTGHGYCK
ncbi:hypothetical protein ONS95_005735 [Cadophora gregata]|uniref:uncharacterized protein n=1 Tax=Cadophora gregata TaxID=51156 RepID=UPI0026DBAB9C|nr:uncharacterized protein ONS95_005735 [Cadophora gregata]KAK0103729.1 hypothetical protein ONS95_005735 [Cadophora gregata]KAK0107916.1 hypothetical protein ONS96_003703 [Cadophora gregata f. sp. sojae]